MKKLILCLICLITICCCAQGESVSALYAEILAYQLKTADVQNAQALIDERFCRDAASGAEWYVIALGQRGNYDLSHYRAALTEHLQNNTVRSKVTLQKYALALLACGGDEAQIAQMLADTIGKQGLMSWVYGLHLMNNGVACNTVSAQDAIDKLLSMQLADGGWVITGPAADADVTAMTVQALAPHASDAKVQAALDRAVQLLSDMQLADGSFASYGKPNAESTAQVWMALSTLGINALEDARFIKNGHTLLDGLKLYQLPDGSFCHTLGSGTNNTATAQAFMAAAAHEEMLCGDGSLLIITENERGEKPAPTNAKQIGYKTIASGIIILLAAIVCVVLLMAKKRSIKNYIAVVVVAAALICIVQCVDIQSADQYYNADAVSKGETIGTVTLSIRCDVLNGKADKAHIPSDGTILPETTFQLAKGETVYDILVEAARAHKLHMESSGTKGLRYVSGIANLYEYDFGDLSGWLYFVNGESLSEGCDSYQLEDGDRIEWLYTCEMGNDLQ